MMQAVLWDMDDTLLNTLPVRMRALEHAYDTCLGQQVDARQVWRDHAGGTLEQLGEQLLGADGQRFVDAYRDYYYQDERAFEPFPGIAEALGELHVDGIPMAVVTSKIAFGAVDELERSQLLPFFEAVVCYDDTEVHKPEPEPLFAAMDRLVINDVDQVLYIGDSPADMLAARNAGCISVAATWGSIDREALLATLPDHVAADPREVLPLVIRNEAAEHAG